MNSLLEEEHIYNENRKKLISCGHTSNMFVLDYK